MVRSPHSALTVWRAVVLVGLLTCLVGASHPVQAQTLDLAWATSAGGGGTDSGASIAVDRAGNSYVTGYHLKNPWLKSPCCSGLPAGGKTGIMARTTRNFSPLEHAALCLKTLTCTALPMNKHANS